MGTASQGAQCRLLVEPGASAHTFDASSEYWEFYQENIGRRGRIAHANAIRGTRSQFVVNTRQASYAVGGRISFPVKPDMLDLFLPRMLGAAESADTFALAETLPWFGMLIDRDADIYEVQDCKVNQWMIEGRTSPDGNGDAELLTLTLDIMAKDDVDAQTWPVSPPSISNAANAAPYVYSDCDTAFQIEGAAREVFGFRLVGNNFLQPRWVNKTTATDISSRDRQISMTCWVPFTSDELALYNVALAGAAAIITFTNGGMSTAFDCDAFQYPAVPPYVRGKQEVIMPIAGVSRVSSGGTEELTVTHDSVA